MPFVDTFFGRIVNRRGLLNNATSVRVRPMPGSRPFQRHVSLHLSIQRCLNGPQRNEMSTADWAGVDDINPPFEPTFSAVVAEYKLHLSHAMTTSAETLLEAKTIELPQGLPREAYIYLGEKLAVHLDSFEMEVYGTLMLVATRPVEGLVPFTALLESGWTTTEVFGANLEALDGPNESVDIDRAAIERPITKKRSCSICLLEIEKDNGRLKCKHYFHVMCIQKWFTRKNTCPNCRRKVAPEDYKDGQDEKENESDGDDEPSTSVKKPKVEEPMASE